MELDHFQPLLHGQDGLDGLGVPEQRPEGQQDKVHDALCRGGEELVQAGRVDLVPVVVEFH